MLIQYIKHIGDRYGWREEWPRWKNLCAAYVLTADYDPLYLAFHGAKERLHEEKFYDLMFAFTLFYNTKAACDVAEAASLTGDFWAR